MPKPAYILAVVLAALAPVAGASAQSEQWSSSRALVDPYFAAKLTLGFGGSATSSFERGSTTFSSDQSLAVSFGVAGQYLYPLHDYFSLGGMLGVQTWRSTGEGDGGRNIVFDLAVLPQGKYVLIPNQLELNVSVPIGLAIDMLNEVDASNTWFSSATGGSAGSSLEGNTALGLVVGVLVGARYQITDSLGALLELGYLYRSVGHTVTTSAGGGLVNVMNDTDVSISWGQFALNLGVYF